jgi:D-alanyl-D-alanine carboxypeptidase
MKRKFNIPFLLAVFLLLFACEKEEFVPISLYDCIPSISIDNSLYSKDAYLQNLLDDYTHHLPGVQVYLRTKDGTEWSGTAGYADIPSDVDLLPCTPMMIASISKMFTSVLILKLYEEGEFSLDDPIHPYLDKSIVSEVKNVDQATFRHLLKHRSGIRDYVRNAIWIDASNIPYYQLEPEEKLKYIYGKSANFPVDQAYSYSNTNYLLLGMIAEKVKNQPLDQLIDSYIVQPLGLLNTVQGTPEDPIPDGTAKPYFAIRNGKFTDITSHAVNDGATGDGGILSNMEELGIFIDALFNDQLLSSATFSEMINDTTRVFSDGELTYSYGMGIQIEETSDGVAYGHTGYAGSYSTSLFYYPATDAIRAVGFTCDASEKDIWIHSVDILDEVIKLVTE